MNDILKSVMNNSLEGKEAKKALNDYQKFVKKELKERDITVKGPEHMKDVANEMKDIGKKWQETKKK